MAPAEEMSSRLQGRLVSALAAMVLTSGVAVAQPPEETSIRELLREGVRHHDEGDFEGAVATFRRALDVDPGNPFALYEMANSFAAMGRYDECVVTVDQALAGDVPEELAGPLHAEAASCLSEKGDAAAALDRFEAGLKRSPDDVSLHFNIAVTLSLAGAAAETEEQQAKSETQRQVDLLVQALRT